MATTKKTEAKITPVKKAASVAGKAKASVKVKPKFEYTVDARVKATRKNGEILSGRVCIKAGEKKTYRMTATGPFVFVNIGTKAAPNVIEVRPKNVKAY